MRTLSHKNTSKKKIADKMSATKNERKAPIKNKMANKKRSLRTSFQTGVAISFLRWGFPRQRERWLGMTAS